MSDEAIPEREARIRDRARALWDEAGRPGGGAEAFLERARDLIAREETRSADLHRLFFRDEPNPIDERIPDADSIRAAVEWNLDHYRDLGWF